MGRAIVQEMKDFGAAVAAAPRRDSKAMVRLGIADAGILALVDIELFGVQAGVALDQDGASGHLFHLL